MRRKLIEMVLKKCTCEYGVGKKIIFKHKFEKTPFYVFLLESFLKLSSDDYNLWNLKLCHLNKFR
jgi:hypothetical protein